MSDKTAPAKAGYLEMVPLRLSRAAWDRLVAQAAQWDVSVEDAFIRLMEAGLAPTLAEIAALEATGVDWLAGLPPCGPYFTVRVAD